MTPEQINELAEKVANGTATPEEELLLLQEMNKGVDALRTMIKTIKEK